MSREYRVRAESLEQLLQVLKPLGETIQYSAQQHQPVKFDNNSFMTFGEAYNKIECEVRKQREPLDLFK